MGLRENCIKAVMLECRVDVDLAADAVDAVVKCVSDRSGEWDTVDSEMHGESAQYLLRLLRGDAR